MSGLHINIGHAARTVPKPYELTKKILKETSDEDLRAWCDEYTMDKWGASRDGMITHLAGIRSMYIEVCGCFV